MRLARLLPLAVALALAVVAISWIRTGNTDAGMALAAGLVAAHGFVHLLFLVRPPDTAAGGTQWPFDLDRSWLASGLHVDAGQLRAFGAGLAIVTAVACIVAGLATAGILLPPEAASRALTGAALASGLLLVTFFSQELVLGFAIDGWLVWLALASGWVPAIA